MKNHPNNPPKDQKSPPSTHKFVNRIIIILAPVILALMAGDCLLAADFTIDAASTYSNYWNIPANQTCPNVDFSFSQDVLPPIHGVVTGATKNVTPGYDDLKLLYTEGEKGKPLGRVVFGANEFSYNTATKQIDNSVWEYYERERLDPLIERGLEPCFMVMFFTPGPHRTSPDSPSCWPDYILHPTDPIFDASHNGLSAYTLPYGHFQEVKEFYRIVASHWKNKVKYWQFGGEIFALICPSLDSSWGDLLPERDKYFSLLGFYEYYRYAVEGILEGNPDAIVGGVGFGGTDYQVHRIKIDNPQYYNYMTSFLDPQSPSYAADCEFPYLAVFMDYCATHPMAVNGVQHPTTRLDFVSWDFNDAVGAIAWDSDRYPSYYLDGTRIPAGTSIYNLKGSNLEIDKVAKAILNAKGARQHLGKNGKPTRMVSAELIICAARDDGSAERGLTRNYQATAMISSLKELIDAGEVHANLFAESFNNNTLSGLAQRGLIKPLNLDPPPCSEQDLIRYNPAPGTKLPMFFLYQMYNMMGGTRLNVQGGFVDGNNGSVSMIASKSPDNNKVTILFWNFSPNTQTIKINANNLPFNKGLYEYYLLDETYDSYRYGPKARPGYKLGDNLKQELAVENSYFFDTNTLNLALSLDKEEIALVVLTNTNLKNQGFENWRPKAAGSTIQIADNFTSWYLGEGIDIAEKSTDAHSGHYSQKVTNDNWNEGLYYANWIPVEPGQMYEVSAWMKVATGQASMLVYTAQDNAWTGAQLAASLCTDSSTWDNVRKVIKIPAGHHSMMVFFRGNPGSTWYLDDLSVKKTDELITGGGFEQSGDSLSDGIQVADHFTSWYLETGIDAASLTHAEHHSGYYSQKVTPARWNYGIYYSGWIAVEPGQTYEVSAWMKMARGQGAMRVFTAADYAWTDARCVASLWTDSNAWDNLTSTVKIPDGHHGMMIFFTGTPECTFYVDDLSLKKADELITGGGFEQSNDSLSDGIQVADHFTSWYLEPGIDTACLTHEDRHSGYYSQKVTNHNWNTGIYYAKWIPVEEGQTYEVSSWMKIPAGQTASMLVYTAQDNAWTGAQTVAGVYTDSRTWENVRAVIKIPAGHHYMKVYFRGAPGSTWYLDDLSVKKTDESINVTLEDIIY